MDDCGTVLAMELAVAVPLLAPAGKAARRSAVTVKAALRVRPFLWPHALCIPPAPAGHAGVGWIRPGVRRMWIPSKGMHMSTFKWAVLAAATVVALSVVVAAAPVVALVAVVAPGAQSARNPGLKIPTVVATGDPDPNEGLPLFAPCPKG